MPLDGGGVPGKEVIRRKEDDRLYGPEPRFRRRFEPLGAFERAFGALDVLGRQLVQVLTRDTQQRGRDWGLERLDAEGESQGKVGDPEGIDAVLTTLRP